MAKKQIAKKRTTPVIVKPRPATSPSRAVPSSGKDGDALALFNRVRDLEEMNDKLINRVTDLEANRRRHDDDLARINADLTVRDEVISMFVDQIAAINTLLDIEGA